MKVEVLPTERALIGYLLAKIHKLDPDLIVVSINVFSFPEPRSSIRPPYSNIFYETTRPISIRFHMQPPENGGTEVCLNSLDHMTKMASKVT